MTAAIIFVVLLIILCTVIWHFVIKGFDGSNDNQGHGC